MELSKPQDSKPYILGGNWLSPKKQIFLVFWGMELYSPKSKKILMFF